MLGVLHQRHVQAPLLRGLGGKAQAVAQVGVHYLVSDCLHEERNDLQAEHYHQPNRCSQRPDHIQPQGQDEGLLVRPVHLCPPDTVLAEEIPVARGGNVIGAPLQSGVLGDHRERAVQLRRQLAQQHPVRIHLPLSRRVILPGVIPLLLGRSALIVRGSSLASAGHALRPICLRAVASLLREAPFSALLQQRHHCGEAPELGRDRLSRRWLGPAPPGGRPAMELPGNGVHCDHCHGRGDYLHISTLSIPVRPHPLQPPLGYLLLLLLLLRLLLRLLRRRLRRGRRRLSFVPPVLRAVALHLLQDFLGVRGNIPKGHDAVGLVFDQKDRVCRNTVGHPGQGQVHGRYTRRQNPSTYHRIHLDIQGKVRGTGHKLENTLGQPRPNRAKVHGPRGFLCLLLPVGQPIQGLHSGAGKLGLGVPVPSEILHRRVF
mmetsp:Transcript_53504/g.122473  ORF Transcript_53504/g.122473 Transcript_53504/m.122473 type:complete len:430 (-) Transcript_53504:421-1710(-)